MQSSIIVFSEVHNKLAIKLVLNSLNWVEEQQDGWYFSSNYVLMFYNIYVFINFYKTIVLINLIGKTEQVVSFSGGRSRLFRQTIFD